MTKVMLIAGVAALAIATPAPAGPHGGHGGGHGGHASAPHQNHGGGGQRRAERPAQRQQHAQRQARAFQQRERGNQQRQARPFQQRERGNQQRQARAFQQRERASQQRQARAFQQRERSHQQRQARAFQQRERSQHQRQARAFQQREQRQAHVFQQRRRIEQQQARAFQQERRNEQRQARAFQQRRHNDQRQARFFQQQQQQQRRMEAQNRIFERRQYVADRMEQRQWRDRRSQRYADYGRFENRRYASNDFRVRYADDRPLRLLGSPLASAASYGSLYELPRQVSYLYPETPNYYYRYGDGYLYQVDRNTNVIDELLPLIGGGYLPGMTFPSSYMNSYVPAGYGFDTFYPDTSYADYRYMDGNVYSLDPYSGTIQDVVPTYAYGYGVGQMLPAGYGYYNVPTQYRSMYYNTPDSNYWYAPGAIYQVDPNSQLITSVASLLAPGMSVGQPLPMGYDTYNVPLAYRSTYYDTPNAWYRYNNGYIYQVDPTTQIVQAIVASLLT